MINFIISIIASLVLLFGLVSIVTPIPGGTFLIAGSLTALICSSPLARRCIQVMRTKMNWLNKGILWVEAKVGDRIGIVGRALRQTRPLAYQEASSDSCSTD